MNQDQMKSQLQRDKSFLKDLFKSDSIAYSKRILTFASDAEINTLLKYLHFVANGQIHIKKENFDRLTKRHLSIIRQKIEEKAKIQTILQAQRKEKLQFLYKLITAFTHLLTPLFRE